ncbi:MAG: alpha/beta fold hydrolase [Bergeyella sp.]|nr:alpha/beta fold hydrolase [Bergeyella sp.]
MTEILHSKIYGEEKGGIPLLVFHGLFGMLDNWGTFGKEASDFFPVHLIDLRNHGKSFRANEMDYLSMANDIAKYMESHHIEKANILGHSLGGKAGIQFSLNFGKKVNKLIVVDIAPKGYPPHHQEVFYALDKVDPSKAKSRKEIKEKLSLYISDKGTVQFLSKNLYRNEDQILHWRFNLDILRERYNDFISKGIYEGIYEGSTLFLKGERSHYILPEDFPEIKKRFPKAEIVSVKNSGHWVQVDNYIDFKTAVFSFLLA